MKKRPEDSSYSRFRIIPAVTAIVLLIGAVSGVVHAAPQGPPEGGFPGPGFGGPPPRREMTAVAVPVATLVSALKLTAAQRTKIQAIQQRARPQWGRGEGGPPPPRSGDGMSGFPPPGGEGGRRGPGSDQWRAQENKAAQEIAAVLTASQRQALPALMKEMDALREVGIPAGTYPSLNLTAVQKAKLGVIARQAHPSGPPPQREGNGGPGGADWQAREKKRSQAHTAALAVLTATQKKTVEAYVRAHPRRGPGGPGGGFSGGMPRGGAPEGKG